MGRQAGLVMDEMRVEWPASRLRRINANGEAVTMPKILVTDEDGLVRWSLRQALLHDGYEVLAVDSPARTLEESLRGTVDVVITDSNFRDSNGIDLLRAIKTSMPKTHVIMITAQGDSRLERLARDIGAFDYFEKPFDVKAVTSSVGRALLTPERRRAPRA
jgi:DNA-binding NtrC family response regulator